MKYHKFQLLKRFVFSFTGLALILQSCTSTQTPSRKDPVILSVGSKPIYQSEFQFVYEKSKISRDSLYLRKSLEDYLDLFVNYKLKISEAELLGIDTTQSFKLEHEEHKKLLSKPYLIDEALRDTLIQEAFTRLQQEVKVAHILVKVPAEADPADSLVAYQKIQEAKNKAQQGSAFADLVQSYSDDTGSKSRKGEIGYFSALQMVYPFETAAYNTPIGEVSPIIRSRFGYHILKVLDRRPARGTVQVAHIMVQVPNNDDSPSYKAKIDEAYQKLEAGGNWDQLCLDYSDDNTKSKGGVLRPFKVGEVLPEFEQNAFALNIPGSYSRPFKTNFGWHIIKLLKKDKNDNFKLLESTLKNQVEKDGRNKLVQLSRIETLKKENNLKVVDNVWKIALQQANEKLIEGSWTYDNRAPNLNETLISFENKSSGRRNYSLKDFYNYIFDKQIARPNLKDSKYLMQLYFETFKNEMTLDFERDNLSSKYRDYALIINEYREGVMLFQLMNEKVWEKAIRDTSACRDFFQKNRENYRWDTRATASIFEAKNEDILNQLKGYLSNQIFPVEEYGKPILYFDRNSSTLSEKSVEAIKKASQLLKDNPGLILEVSAHADPGENEGLAQGRLDPTVKYLVFEGAPSDRIRQINYESSRPVSRDERNKNQRVEFRFVTKQKKQLEKVLNKTQKDNLKVTEGTFQKGDNVYLDRVNWEPGVYNLQADNKKIYIEINNIIEPRRKEYDEARGYVITDYQKFLEDQWLEELKDRYEVQINQEVVESLIKQ